MKKKFIPAKPKAVMKFLEEAHPLINGPLINYYSIRSYMMDGTIPQENGKIDTRSLWCLCNTVCDRVGIYGSGLPERTAHRYMNDPEFLEESCAHRFFGTWLFCGSGVANYRARRKEKNKKARLANFPTAGTPPR